MESKQLLGAAASTSSGWVTLGLMYREQEWVWKPLFAFSPLHSEEITKQGTGERRGCLKAGHFLKTMYFASNPSALLAAAQANSLDPNYLPTHSNNS